MMFDVLRADWPAPKNIHACTTTRAGGVSVAPFDALNVGDHCGDDVKAVQENRARLRQHLALPAEPQWLQQVHGINVVDAMQMSARVADAAFTTQRGVVLSIMTADCLPLLICNRAGNWISTAHAGWRGLCGGVIEQTIACYDGDKNDLLVWLGPAIGPDAFEVGDEVKAAFIAHDAQAALAFKPSPQGRWLADLFLLARQRLARLGITSVFGGGVCTYSDAKRFYSFRRDKTTGRMASLIWME